MNESLYLCRGVPIGVPDVVRALIELGIKKNDVVMIHADLTPFGRLAAKSRDSLCSQWTEALQTCIGTLIVPTFSYSFCRGEVFDIESTPSAVGLLTEYFRKQPGVIRTQDAIFSCALWGENADKFADVGLDCFGEGSIFEKLYKANAKILDIGDTFALTYIHFIEQAAFVPYRYEKTFSGTICCEGSRSEREFKYFVRRLDQPSSFDSNKVKNFFTECSHVKSQPLGCGSLSVYPCADIYNTCMEKLRDNPYFLL